MPSQDPKREENPQRPAPQEQEQGERGDETTSAWAQQQQHGDGDDADAISGGGAASSYQVPLNDTNVDSSSGGQRRHPQSRRRRPRSRSRGPSSQQPCSDEEEAAEPASLQDRLTGAALAGTLDVLKLLGGVTLSTTGKLAAPPLHVTRTFLLPSLWAALVDYVSSTSPTRLRDWYRIVRSSVHHIVNTLKNTDAGHAFRSRLLLVVTDLVDCLSNDTTRQLLLDSVGCSVQLAEALHTPEWQAWMQQLTVTACRGVEALADGRTQLLLHDLQTAAWTGCELLADPETVTAMAEVTAYLCYALEMEQQGLHNPQQRQDNKDGTTRRRRERQRYQAAVANDRTTLQTNPDVTVEEVILSSLGVDLDDDDDNNDDDGENSVPHSIVLETTQSSNKNNPLPDSGGGGGGGSGASSTIRTSSQQQTDDASTSGGTTASRQSHKKAQAEEWHEQARNGVDVQFLREHIEKRAAQKKMDRQAAATSR